MKLNWGSGIVIVMALFIGMIVFFVVRSLSLSPDLVHEDYYEREVSYEHKVIEPRKYAKSIGLDLDFYQDADILEFKVNKGLLCDSIHVEMIYKAGKEGDFVKTFVQQNPNLAFTKSAFKKGAYQLSIHYYFQDQDALIEKEIAIE